MASLTSDGTISDIVIGHAAAVLPDRVVDDARVVVRGDRITEVGTHPRGAECDLDARGAFVLPGLVDVHSDLSRPGDDGDSEATERTSLSCLHHPHIRHLNHPKTTRKNTHNKHENQRKRPCGHKRHAAMSARTPTPIVEIVRGAGSVP